jgi:hypothetical protein
MLNLRIILRVAHLFPPGSLPIRAGSFATEVPQDDAGMEGSFGGITSRLF